LRTVCTSNAGPCTIHVYMLPFLNPGERTFLSAVSELAYSNPFLPARIQCERAALGGDFVEGEPVWSLPVDEPERPRANAWRIVERLDPLAEELRSRLGRTKASERDMLLYEDAMVHLLYQRYYRQFFEASFGAAVGTSGRWRFYNAFLSDWKHFFEAPGIRLPSPNDASHIFACFRQIQRAFEQIFRDIIGGSPAAARLRAAVWQSIFTHDMRRYRRTLYAKMGDFATLITGPSGTGKELAARAIGQSRYLSFDDRNLTFPDEDAPSFFPINISALPSALVESALFGHRRGSFTGAIADRKGWLEACPASGAVFLDELGDLDPAIQVKLLRVIETRSFHPVGETAPRQFRGKLIAATNRDLESAIQKGLFREDLYYRLCSDQISTPSLAEQVAGSPQVLRELVVYMARKVAGAESDALVREVTGWIERNLDPGYAWPGNYRELEQCVKNVLIRSDYRPSGTGVFTTNGPGDPVGEFFKEIRGGRLNANDVLTRYCTMVYSQTGSYEETARRTGLDRRTVKSRVDPAFLARLRRTVM